MGTARLSAQDGTATGNLCLCGLGATNTNTSHSGETFIERCVIDVRTCGARIADDLAAAWPQSHRLHTA